MHRAILFLYIYFGLTSEVRPQVFTPRSAALSGFSVIDPTAFALHSNPGSMDDTKHITFSCSSLYGVKEYTPLSLAIQWGVERQCMAVGIEVIPLTIGWESSIMAAFSLEILPELYIGTRIGYRISPSYNTEQHHRPSLTIGCTYMLTEKVRIGFVGNDILRSTIAQAPFERTAAAMSLGAEYSSSDQLRFALQVDHRSYSASLICFGLELERNELWYRIGFNSARSLGTGLCIKKGDFTYHISLSYNPYLFVTPTIGIDHALAF